MRWADECKTCHYRPCRCREIKIQETRHSTVQAFVDCSTGERQKRWRLIAQVVDLLPLRPEEFESLFDYMEREVCSTCDRTSDEDVCKHCRGSSFCHHGCRRDECLFCGDFI